MSTGNIASAFADKWFVWTVALIGLGLTYFAFDYNLVAINVYMAVFTLIMVLLGVRSVQREVSGPLRF